MRPSIVSSRLTRVLVAPFLLAVLALAACAGVVGPGTPYPPSAGYPAPSADRTLHGAVRNVDHANRRFLVDEGSGADADVAYDAGTRLVYQGREQPVGGLEFGDSVRVRAVSEGGLWRARDIEVLADVRQVGSGGDEGAMERRGAISRVDPRSRTIVYTEGGYSGGERSVAYDGRTTVEYRGQPYRPEALERGDLVRLRLARGERGWVASRILVEVSARER